MDTFDRAMRDIADMPAKNQVDTLKRLKELCKCPTCSTYTNCARNAKEYLYCYNGKSFMCIDREHECICTECPVCRELNIRNRLFCIRGSEKAQRYEHSLPAPPVTR